MVYRVGAYSFSVGKPFKTIDDAVTSIQKESPELSREVIEKHLNPKINVREDNKSDGVYIESSEAGTTISKNNKGRVQAGGSSKD